MKLPPIDWQSIDKYDLRVIPLRGPTDKLRRLQQSIYKQAIRHSFIDGSPRDFRLLASEQDATVTIVRLT